MRSLIVSICLIFSLSASFGFAQSQQENIIVAQTQAGFENWVQNFKSKALRSGVSSRTFDRAFQGVKLNSFVISKDRKQLEFSSQIWDYLDIAVSDKRVENGRKKHSSLKRRVRQIEKAYGVQSEVFVAIWGLETAYGSNMGDINIIEALATLAYEGRRRSFAEGQLIEALKIIQAGDIKPSEMKGSWAGAMGHTQFIPTSFQAFAQDFKGDGRRDVWNPSDPTDALASTANYLRENGWQKGRPWGYEVRLPSGFNFASAGLKKSASTGRWNRLGVRLMSGEMVPNHGEASILLPAGAQGPAFIVFKNFHVIKRYNNANSYALAVGHLSDRINGGGRFEGVWPRDDDALSYDERKELQEKLTKKGFDTQGADGLIGPNTVSAIRRFQSSLGLVPDGHPTKKLLDLLR